MPVYEVKVRQGAKIVQQTVVARDAGEARLLGARAGTVLGSPKQRRDGFGGGMTPSERYVFLYQLATLNVARYPLSDALKSLRLYHSGRIGKAAASLESGVAAGRQIADLMVEDKKNFPGAVGLLVKAGSKGIGGTAAALKKAADFERDILNATTKGAKGVWVAGFWVLLATIGNFACAFWLTPYMKNNELFHMTSAKLDWQWLDNLAIISGILTMIFMLLGLALVFLVGLGQKLFPSVSDAIVMRLPYLKDIVFTRDNYISLYRFSLMVKAGVSLEEALETTWTDTRPGALREDLRRALTNVKTGRPWADGFRTLSDIDRKALQMASDKDRLADIMSEVAEQNRALYVRRLEFLEPMMKVVQVLGISTLFVVVNLYSIVPFSQLFSSLMAEANSLN